MADGSRLRVLLPRPDKKPLMDLWSKQSDQMWRTVYATPAIAAAIFAGWYAVLKDNKPNLAMLVLFVGILMMVIQALVLHRMSLYLNMLRASVGKELPHVERARVLSVPLPSG